MRGARKNYGNFKEFESVNIGEKIQFFEQEFGLSRCDLDLLTLVGHKLWG